MFLFLYFCNIVLVSKLRNYWQQLATCRIQQMSHPVKSHIRMYAMPRTILNILATCRTSFYFCATLATYALTSFLVAFWTYILLHFRMLATIAAFLNIPVTQMTSEPLLESHFDLRFIQQQSVGLYLYFQHTRQLSRIASEAASRTVTFEIHRRSIICQSHRYFLVLPHCWNLQL